MNILKSKGGGIMPRHEITTPVGEPDFNVKPSGFDATRQHTDPKLSPNIEFVYKKGNLKVSWKEEPGNGGGSKDGEIGQPKSDSKLGPTLTASPVASSQERPAQQPARKTT